jgi:hypothetical protein
MPVLLVTKLILKKFKKVVKNLIEGVKIQTCNPNFCHDKSKLEDVGFLNHHNYTVSGSGGGLTKLPSKIYQIMTNLNP